MNNLDLMCSVYNTKNSCFIMTEDFSITEERKNTKQTIGSLIA
jgi:hypothetical protein